MSYVIRSALVETKLACYRNVAGKISPIIRSVGSHQASGSPTSMDKIQHSQEPTQKEKGDMMSHSFENGYSTRSDEEGFGGCFTGNDSLSSKDQDKIVHANSPEYDKTEGNEPTEKGEG